MAFVFDHLFWVVCGIVLLGTFVLLVYRTRRLKAELRARGWTWKVRAPEYFSKYAHIQPRKRGERHRQGSLITGVHDGVPFRYFVYSIQYGSKGSLFQVFMVVNLPGSAGRGFLAVAGPESTFVDTTHDLLELVALRLPNPPVPEDPMGSFLVSGDQDLAKRFLTPGVWAVMQANPGYAWVFENDELIVIQPGYAKDPIGLMENTVTEIRRLMDHLGH